MSLTNPYEQRVTTNGRITLTPRLLPIAEHLWLNSALGFCTEFTGDQLVTDRPTSLLKAPERVLWQALKLLSLDGWDGTGAILTDHPDLDVPNRAALSTAIDMWEAAS